MLPLPFRFIVFVWAYFQWLFGIDGLQFRFYNCIRNNYSAEFSGKDFERVLKERVERFNTRFEEVYGLEKKVGRTFGLPDEELKNVFHICGC